MFNRSKVWAAYILAVPLALILGFLVASPSELTIMLIGMLLFFLALPLFITWHHAILIIFWNSAFSAFILPGQPALWLLCAALSFSLSILNHVMGRKQFLVVHEMNRPLLLLATVVLLTAVFRGGIGLQALGGATHGGKNYVYIFGAIVGYYALTGGHVPIHKGRWFAGLFFFSGTSYVLSNLAYFLGPAFYFLYYLVPSNLAMGQAASDLGLTGIDRISGLGPGCIAALCFLLAIYGIRGVFDLSKPWRLLFFCAMIAASFFAGFRSVLMLLFLIFAFQFYLEGLCRMRFLAVLSGVMVCGLIVLVLFANKMPMAVQRTISFLPVAVDSSVRADAAASTEWRLQMWSVVLREAPKYLVIGKGYAFDPGEMDLTQESIRLGLISNYEEALLAGDYHSGPLSILVPFGLAGTLAFIWVMVAGFRVLLSNYRYGNARLRNINTILLSSYLGYLVSFVFIFGSFSSQLFIFLGAVGLSVSLNGGVRKKSALLPEYWRSTQSQEYAVEVE